MPIDPILLLKDALKAAANAHAPYSNYRVGAALLCDDGSVYAGCNVENASYGLTICAERSAIFSAVSDGHRTFQAMAIVTSGEQMPYPCGACRQVLTEFCGPGFTVYIALAGNLTNSFEVLTLGELLPHAFSL